MRAVGGEPRKSKEHFAVTKSKAPANFRRAFSWLRSGTSSKNTNLKGLISFIFLNISSKGCATSLGKLATILCGNTRTSSENAGDVTVENTSMMRV